MKLHEFFDSLQDRGLINNHTPGIREHLAGAPRTGYIGFDPTADSLGIGNLAQIVTLRRFQAAGHKPLVLLGGGTGLIGDPSGKSAEREWLSPNAVASHTDSIERQIRVLLPEAEFVNNADWIPGLPMGQFLRDVGKHFSINAMLNMDSVKSRVSGENHTGMSFTEFSYSLLQAYDFARLSTHYDASIQMGGADQWGNICAGTHLVSKMHPKAVFGLTTNLVTREDGSKFGKSEGGNIWLSSAKTKPFDFYQYWFSLTPQEAAKASAVFLESNEPAGARLAAAMTSLVHSKPVMECVEFMRNMMRFDAASLPKLCEGRPSTSIMSYAISAGVPIAYLGRDLTAGVLSMRHVSAIAKAANISNSELIRAMKAGSVAINGEVARGAGTALKLLPLDGAPIGVLRLGKRKMCLLAGID